MQGDTSVARFKNNARLFVKQKEDKMFDPNRPRRPPSPFFYFMEGFRMQFKGNLTLKGLAAIGKAGVDKWRSMSYYDKAKFRTIAEQRIKNYEKKMKAYENELAGGKGVNFNWNMKKKKRGRFYKRKKKIYDWGVETSEEILKKTIGWKQRIGRGREICIVSTSSDDEEGEKVESIDGSRKRIRRANSNGKKGSSNSECSDSGGEDKGFVPENDSVGGDLDEEGEVRKMRALFQKMIVDVEGQDIDKMGGSVDQDIQDEMEVSESSGKQMKVNYEETKLRSRRREEDVIVRNVFDKKLNESFSEDDRVPNRCKKSSTNKDGEENCRTRTRGQNKEGDTSKDGLTSLEGGGRIDENGDPLSVMCHQCLKNNKCLVVVCRNCKGKRYCVPSMTKCVPPLQSEDWFLSSKSCNSFSKVAGHSLVSDLKSVPSTSDKVVKDCRQKFSAMEDMPSKKGRKEVYTINDTTTSKIDSTKQFVEVVPNATNSGQPVHTSSTLHDSPNNSHQTPKSIATETVGFFKQLEDMLHGNKADWVLPQIQLDEQTIGDYEQMLKTGLSKDLKDLFKDSTYREFNEALTGLLACRKIPSNLQQGFLTLRRDLPSLASRVFELNTKITQGMLQRVNRSTMKELESCLHKYRKCEEHLLKLEQEKEQNVSEINRLKARNQVIDSEIATYTAETDALQKASAIQSLKIGNLDVAGALNESTLQRSLDDLNNMENEWRKRANMLDF